MPTEPLEHRIWIDAPVSDVWQAWVDEEKITQWFAPSAHIEPWPGGAFEVYFEPSTPERQNTRGCKLIEVVPHEKLVFQWKGPDDFASFMNYPEPQTRVSVTFTPEGDATRLHLVHTGWGEGEDWEQAWSWHEIAWSDVLEAAKHLLEESTEELRQLGDDDEPADDSELDLGLDFDDMLPPAPRAERRPSPFAAPPPKPAAAKPAAKPVAVRPVKPAHAAKPAKAAAKPVKKAKAAVAAKPKKKSRPAAAAPAKSKPATARKAAKKATSAQPQPRKVVKKVAKKKAAKKKVAKKAVKKKVAKKAVKKKVAKKKAAKKK